MYKLDCDSRDKTIFTLIEKQEGKTTTTQMSYILGDIFKMSHRTIYNIWFHMKKIGHDELLKIKISEELLKSVDEKIAERLNIKKSKDDLIKFMAELNDGIKEFIKYKKERKNKSAVVVCEIILYILTKEFGYDFIDSLPFFKNRDHNSRVKYIVNRVTKYIYMENTYKKDIFELSEQQKAWIEEFFEARKSDLKINNKNSSNENDTIKESSVEEESYICKDCESLKEQNAKLMDTINAYRLIFKENNQS